VPSVIIQKASSKLVWGRIFGSLLTYPCSIYGNLFQVADYPQGSRTENTRCFLEHIVTW